MKKQELNHLERIEQYNIYQCLELFRNLQELEPELSKASQYKACRRKVEQRIIQLVSL